MKDRRAPPVGEDVVTIIVVLLRWYIIGVATIFALLGIGILSIF